MIPKPVQQPHPPIFAACSRPESVELAGSLGIGSLNFTAGNDEYLSRKIASYRTQIANARGPAGKVNNRFCCTPATLVLADDRRACEYGFRGARFFQESLGTYFLARERNTGPLEVSRDPLTKTELEKAMASRNGAASTLTAVIGDPAAAIESVRRFQGRRCRRIDSRNGHGHRAPRDRNRVVENLRRKGNAALRLEIGRRPAAARVSAAEVHAGFWACRNPLRRYRAEHRCSSIQPTLVFPRQPLSSKSV